MEKLPLRTRVPVLTLFAGLVSTGRPGSAQTAAAAPAAPAGYGAPAHPTITAGGKDYTPLSIVTRNMGTAADQTEQFPPHHIIGNIYYVGTRTLSSFLIVTPAGNILLDSTYERNVPTIAKSVASLGFKFTDVKILLGNQQQTREW